MRAWSVVGLPFNKILRLLTGVLSGADCPVYNGRKRYGSSSKKCRENDIAFHFSGVRKLPRRPTAVDCRSHVYLHGQLRRSSRLHDDDDDDDKLKSRRAPTTTVAVA